MENNYDSLNMIFVECAKKLKWNPTDEDLLIVSHIIYAALEAKLEIYQESKGRADHVKNRIILGIPFGRKSNRHTPLLYIKRSKGITSLSWNSNHSRYSPYKDASEKKIFSVWNDKNSNVYAQNAIWAAKEQGLKLDSRHATVTNRQADLTMIGAGSKRPILVSPLDSPEDWIKAESDREGPNNIHQDFFLNSRQKYLFFYDLSQRCIQSFLGAMKPRIGASGGHPWWSTSKWSTESGCIYIFCKIDGIEAHIVLSHEKITHLCSLNSDFFRVKSKTQSVIGGNATQNSQATCTIEYSKFYKHVQVMENGLKAVGVWDFGNDENTFSSPDSSENGTDPQLQLQWKQVSRELRVRDRKVVAKVLGLAKGQCALCVMRSKQVKSSTEFAPAARFKTATNSGYLEVHHIDGLAIRGEDSVRNCVALHADCHAEAHYSGKEQREAIKALLKKAKKP